MVAAQHQVSLAILAIGFLASPATAFIPGGVPRMPHVQVPSTISSRGRVGITAQAAAAAAAGDTAKTLQVLIYSDIAWPWCYVGDQSLQSAVDEAEKEGAEVEVRYQPYMIDPNTKAEGEEYGAYCRRRWGGDGWTQQLRSRGQREGLPFASWATWPNTFNAHRLCVLLRERDQENGLAQKEIAGRNAKLVRKFFELTYERGQNISTPEGAALAMVELGYSTREEAEEYLRGRGGEAEVVAADSHAKGVKAIRGVPFFVIGREGSQGGATTFNGAQQSGTFLAAFRQQMGA